MTRSTFNKLALSSVISALSTPVLAQGFALEEIIVTASKREQSLQNVPIAVTALSAEKLVSSGVSDVEDMTVVTPGLTVGYQGGGVVLYLRGVGSSDVTAGAESAIAMYVDGVYMPESYGNQMAFNNIERIEVLRGPQGTLFGRNATGGLINIVTKDPGQETFIDASVSYGNYDTVGAKFYGSTGIADDLTADLSLYYSDQREGFGTNVANGRDTNITQELLLRSKWLWTPGDDTRVSLALDYTDIATDKGTAYRLLGNSRSLMEGTPHPGGFYDINANFQPITEVEGWGASLNIRHALAWADFVSISSYRETEVFFMFDNDITPVPAIDVTADLQTRQSISQEFQLVSTADGPLTWIAGLYYFNDDAGFDDPRGLVLSGVALPTYPATPHTINMIDTESYAIFGEGTYELTPTTRLTLGARWTRDERKLDGRVDLFMQGEGVIQTIPNSSLGTENRLSYEEPTYRAILDHDFSDNVFGFVSYSRGFRSGSFAVVDASNPPFEPETLDAIEIGLKTQWIDRRLTLNLAAFDYSYENMQFVIQRGITTVTDNAAESSIRGFEIESSFAATPNLDLFLTASILDTEYDSFPEAARSIPVASGGNEVTSADASGNKIMRTADLTLTAGTNYHLPTALGDFDVNLTYYYNDGFYWHPENRLKEDAYHIVNANITWSRANSPVSLMVYGKNLLDEEYSIYTETGPFADQFSPGAPLTFGVELRAQY
ncbi:MAG: TonB-dependent receptor [Porticoccaceae bacterium]